MKLDEFVKRTLLDITNGVTEAQKHSLVWIAPGYVENKKVESPQMVNFEISVTVTKEAGGGIDVLSFGELKAAANSEDRHRISFEVPVYFQSPTPRNKNHHSKN